MHASSELPAGTLLRDRYEILARIAHGELTTVYQGYDRLQNQTVALKVLSRSPASVALQERHTSPARLGTVLTDPGLVRVWDVHVDADPPFVVLELVDGSSLADWAGYEFLASADIARLGASLCSTLATIHEAGFVHANLEPANILVPAGPSGLVKLTDLGISTFSALDRLTSVRVPVSPHDYQGPEVFAGRSFDQSADVYSAGQILAECLTGQVISDAGPDLGIDPAWSELLYAMTAVAPQDRPTAREAADELDMLTAALSLTEITEPLAAANGRANNGTDGHRDAPVRNDDAEHESHTAEAIDATAISNFKPSGQAHGPYRRRVGSAILVFSEVLVVSVLVFALLNWVGDRAGDGTAPPRETADRHRVPGEPSSAPSEPASWSDRLEYDGPTGSGNQDPAPEFGRNDRLPDRQPRYGPGDEPDSGQGTGGRQSDPGHERPSDPPSDPPSDAPSDPPPSESPDDPEPSDPPPTDEPDDPEPSDPPPTDEPDDPEPSDPPSESPDDPEPSDGPSEGPSEGSQ